MTACYDADKFLSEIKKASRAGKIKKDSIEAMVEEAVVKNIISSAERDRIIEAEALRDDAIQVDDFSFEEYKLGIGRNPCILYTSDAADDYYKVEVSVVGGSL